MFAVSLALPSVPVSAQSSSSLTIAPRKDYVIEPGKSVKDTINIRNTDNNSALDLSMRVIDFTYTDDTGTPKFFLDKNAPQTTWSLKDYLKTPSRLNIEPGKNEKADISVNIPAGLGAGTYYSAIIYQSGAPQAGQAQNVGLSASGVTLVFVNVPGKVHEDLKFEKLGAYFNRTQSDEGGYRFITMDEPLNIGYTLKNSGNVAEKPMGMITLKDMFGHEYNIENINPNGLLALREQTRTFTTCIKLNKQSVDFNGDKTQANTCTAAGLWPGMYTVTADMYYGQNGNTTQEITSKAVFWYMPWWFIVICIVVLLIASYYTWRIYSYFKYGRGNSPHRGGRIKIRRSRGRK